MKPFSGAGHAQLQGNAQFDFVRKRRIRRKIGDERYEVIFGSIERASAKTVAQSLADLTIKASISVLTSMYEPAGIPNFEGDREAAVCDTFNLSLNFNLPRSMALNAIYKVINLVKDAG